MKTRTITSLAALAIFVPILWIGSWPLLVGSLGLAIIAMSEIFMMKKKRFFSLTGLTAVLTAAVLVVPEEMLAFLPTVLTSHHLFYLSGMLLLAMTVLSKNDFTFDDAGVFMLAALYIGTGFHYFLATAEYGFFMVLFVLMIVWGSDIGAYLVGMRFGKHKLAPLISPNKSVEGAVGGILFAAAVAILYGQFYNPFGFSLRTLFTMGVILSMVGQLGDLTESAYKRYFGVKDSGKILPGHGGILDRFDSMLFVMPAFQLFLRFIQY